MLIISSNFVACNNEKTILVRNINQIVAQEITFLLETNNIDTSEEVDKSGLLYNIYVHNNDKLLALKLLHNRGMPNASFSSFGEIFKKDSFISSPLEEHARFLYALNQEVSAMLSELNGVVAVKTAISIATPNDGLWQSDVPKPSASVLIKFQQGARVDLYISRIKNIVSNSVPGLTPDRVEVVTIVQKSY